MASFATTRLISNRNTGALKQNASGKITLVTSRPVSRYVCRFLLHCSLSASAITDTHRPPSLSPLLSFSHFLLSSLLHTSTENLSLHLNPSSLEQAVAPTTWKITPSVLKRSPSAASSPQLASVSSATASAPFSNSSLAQTSPLSSSSTVSPSLY